MKVGRIIFTAALSTAALSFVSCKIDKQALFHQRRSSEPVQVRVSEVKNEKFSSSTNYVGRVEPSKSTIVMSSVPGVVSQLPAREGMRVSAGDVLALINSEVVQSAYDMAKATLVQAEDGYERAKKVYDNGSISEVKMVEISTQLQKAISAEKAARKALDDCSVKAPFSGVISKVFVHQAENILPAAPVVQLVNVESVEIHINVPESEYSRIKLGDPAKVEIPALEKTVGAKVTVKGVNASPLSHSYDFTLGNISGDADIVPGMVCKVFIGFSDGKNIVIPASAVLTDINGRYVWTVEEGDIVGKRYVSVGGFSGKGIIVEDGLSIGDRVVVQGSRKVSTGMKVKAVKE